MPGHLLWSKMAPHGATGTNQGVCNGLLGYMQFLCDLLLHQRFSVIKLHHLPLAGSQHLDVVEHDIDGSNSHEQSRNILRIDPCLFHAGQQVFDQITDLAAVISDRAGDADRSVCARDQGRYPVHLAIQTRSSAFQEGAFHDQVTQFLIDLLT